MLNYWTLTLIGALLMATICDSRKISNELKTVLYNTVLPHNMTMGESGNVDVIMKFDRNSLNKVDVITVSFKTVTLSPQFPILELNNASKLIEITSKQLEASDYEPRFEINLKANYIGHALVKPVELLIKSLNGTTLKVLFDDKSPYKDLHVIVVQYEGIWGKIFIVSVSIFIIITYINLGAQLDTERVEQILAKPITVVLGFLITVIVMPLVSWLACKWLLKDQLLYTIGSYIFACGPTASASTLWTAMLDSDKELSVGLQVASTMGALATMPLLLYLMDTNQVETNHTIKVPYARLLQTLLVLTLALFIGWRFIGRNERAQKISRKMFRPLTFFVLIFIVVFSSIVYWHIYKMFDWNITLTSLLITLLTYFITGFLGYMINCNLEQAIAISISSAYKNSGIAFAVLLVAFGPPDTYIAYVPCLTQVVTTSISLYLVYIILSLIKCIRRRGQPEVIQATPAADDDGGDDDRKAQNKKEDSVPKKKEIRSGSDSSVKSGREGENDEFIAMNVTDIVPGSPTSINRTSKSNEQEAEA